ncbi:hypothetical protein [Microbacterium sp. NIBRBAC000506063]|uniref:hypothetical protein n=1 Tax=Microbacterium sp. NIBRBAC000506063 TaxID=2734618 RepID=UPI001BB7F6F3|nr:hypothetical protein [Microbacterium sp. NIBRBAC000506063]QTV79438.1 hypothetical protein KAE78_11055 [Microbacterium sp. NIBRBAC000506063]
MRGLVDELFCRQGPRFAGRSVSGSTRGDFIDRGSGIIARTARLGHRRLAQPFPDRVVLLRRDPLRGDRATERCMPRLGRARSIVHPGSRFTLTRRSGVGRRADRRGSGTAALQESRSELHLLGRLGPRRSGEILQ